MGRRRFGGDVAFDTTGNLYPTTRDGGLNIDYSWGEGWGSVYKVTPTTHRYHLD